MRVGPERKQEKTSLIEQEPNIFKATDPSGFYILNF
jgi:hypothetical protein